MENLVIDLRMRIQELEKENIALKTKMTLMYSNWSYDYNRFMELKEKCQRKNAIYDISNNTIKKHPNLI